VAGPKGTLYATWTEYDGPLWFSRSTDGGKSFSRPMRIAGQGAAAVARAPALALAPDGALHLAWTLGDNDAADIHLAKSTDGGATFGKPRLLAPSRSYSDAPKLAVDGKGVVHLVYAESAGGPFARYRIHHARSLDGGRSFSEPRDISSPMPDGFTSAAFPSLGVDARGHVYVLWELFPDPKQPPRGLALAVSRDQGGSFAPPAVVPGSIDPAGGSNGGSQGLLMRKLAVNADGALAVVNSSFKQDARSRVWLMRGSVAR
jgi:hypothetical protein